MHRMNNCKIPMPLVRGYWKIFDWFAAPGQREHPVRAFRLHAFLLMFTVSQLLMILFAVLGRIYIPSRVMIWSPPICILLATAGLLSYRRHQSMSLAANIFLTSVTAYIFSFCWVNNGFQQTSFVWFGLIPLVAGMLINKRTHSIGWTALVIGLCAFGFWATQNGMTYSLLQEEAYVLYTTIEQSGFLLTAGIISWFILLEKRISSDHLRDKTVAKQNLLRILAHDISNPLSVIRISSQFLAEEAHSPESRSLLLQMDRSSLRIAEIIQLIRDMEALQGNKKRLNLVPISLRQSLNELLITHQHRLDTKGIKIEIQIEDDPHVMGHATMLMEQVLGNILVNAIKFSPNDSKIIIQVTNLRGEVEIAINDNGIGIPADHMADLFDPLSSLSRRGTAGESGHGHGLSIAKNCMELMGGSIRLQSTQSQGTSVKVKLCSA